MCKSTARSALYLWLQGVKARPQGITTKGRVDCKSKEPGRYCLIHILVLPGSRHWQDLRNMCRCKRCRDCGFVSGQARGQQASRQM